MKTNKLNLLLILLTLGMFAFSSCQDEFTEEDFLKLQAELSQENAIEQLLLQMELARANDSAMAALQHEINLAYDAYKKEENLDALRQAGLITSYTVKFENDGLPAAGVGITLTTSDAARTFEGVADASGIATLADVPVGTSVVRISGEGLVPMKGVVSFGALTSGVDYVTGFNGTIYPLGRNESSVLEVFSSGTAAGQMATITGRVTIETDLTNAVPEIPQDITVNAILTTASDISNNNVSPNVAVTLSFDSNTIGVGVVDNATGEYSMPVPARKEGLRFDLTVPTVEATQRLAITTRDGVLLDAPEYADVQTVFGANSGTLDAVPNVPGARAVFTTPAAPGTGVKTTAFTPIARPLVDASIFNFEADNEDINFSGGLGTAMVMTSRGVYKTVPALTISGGSGSGATATATVKGYVSGLTVTNRGSGFGDSQPVAITIQAVDADNGPLLALFDVNVTSTADGLLPATINLATANITNITGGGEDKDNPFTFPAGIRNVTATVGGGAAITVAYTGYLTAVTVNNGGTSFNSLPVLSFAQATGTTGDTQAAVTFAAMEFEYEFSIDNSEASEYTVLPAAFVFEVGDDFENGSITKNKTTTVTRYFQGNKGSGNLIGMLRVSGGDVVPEALGSTFRVTSWGAPTATVAPSEAIMPVVTVNINNGAVTSLSVQNATTDNDPNIGGSFAVGRGYPAPIEVTIVPAIDGAPGAGASVQLSNVNERSDKTYTWVDSGGAFSGDQSVLSGGSGYLPDLNQTPTTAPTPLPSGSLTGISVRPGDVIIYDYNFGTGNRKENVN